MTAHSILKSELKGLALLKKANLIFNKISESELQEPRLIYLAEQLAGKCFKEGSSDYFTDISDSIENELLDKDWDLAPWYRKIAHVFSFGYFRVDRHASVDSITIDLDFRGEEFQTHFAQLEYISHSAFKVFGKTQAMNFIDFIHNNLEQIRPIEKKESPKEVVVNAHERDPKHNQVLELDDSSLPEDLDLGTVVISHDETPAKEDKKSSIKQEPKPEPVVNAGQEEAESDAATNKRRRAKIVKFRTYRSTLFSGDGTLPSRKQERHIPTVEEIFEPSLPPPSL